jgi:adenylylsulfate kinase-like enzyme
MEKKGTLFWITGLSGSGKTTLAKKIYPFIKKKFGPTVHLDGDTLRSIFELHGYSYDERFSNSVKFTKLAKLLTDQGINVIFSIVGLMNKTRNWNRKNINNYIEIFIKTDLKKIISFNKKKIYKNNKKEVVGISIKPQFPKKPDILVNNNLNDNINSLNLKLQKEITKLLIN